MFQIVVIPNNSTANTALFYRTQEKAEIAYKNIHDILKGVKAIDVIQQTDEFGVTVVIPKENINYALLIDINKQAEIQTALARPMPPQPQEPAKGLLEV